MPLSRFTTAGITTVIGLLGTDDVARGPGELLATLYSLREEGLNAYGYAGGYHVPPVTLTGSVRGDLVLRRATDRHRRGRNQRSSFEPANAR
jgi:beta-aspartyl-dipeptidase (metallo-type)